MRILTQFILALGLATSLLSFSSCMKSKGAGAQQKAKLDSKPQIVDVLKDKPSAEVLKMKYTAVTGNCSLLVTKEPKIKVPVPTSAVSFTATSPTPPPPAILPPALSNPNENMLVYDIVSQAKVDAKLEKENKTVLKITKTSRNDQEAVVHIKFAPVVFAAQLNVDLDRAKYIMKHTPVLAYNYNYTLVHGDMSMSGRGSGTINERIRTEKEIATYQTDKFSYLLSLSCSIESSINTQDTENAKEFENQWSCIGCVTTDPPENP